MFFLTKSKTATGGTYTLSRTLNGNIQWVITRPFAGKYIDWTAEITATASFFNLDVGIDRTMGLVTVRPLCGENKGIPGKTPPEVEFTTDGDGWRGAYCHFVDAIITNKTTNTLPFDISAEKLDSFMNYRPPVHAPLVGKEKTADYIVKTSPTGASFLRVGRDVSYTQALSFGIKHLRKDITCGDTTGLKVIECACGRCWVGSDKPLLRNQGGRAWRHCGCLRDPAEMLSAKDKTFAAWREYCTMKLASCDNTVAINQALRKLDLSCADTLPDFPAFKEWFFQNSFKKGSYFLERIDKSSPFTLSNLYFPEKRHIFVDDEDESCYILAL